jgi:uncharacterized protein
MRSRLITAVVLLAALLQGARADAKADLFAACEKGDLKGVAQALALGADVNAQPTDYLGQTALMLAARSGKPEVVRYLVERGARVDATAKGKEGLVVFAALGKSTEIVDYLIAKGAKVDARNGEGDSALMFAIHYSAGEDCRPMMGRLIERGADVDAKNALGTTVLIYAIMFADERAVELLLQKGADVGARNDDGSSALDYAEMFKKSGIARLLKSKGAR